MEIVNCQAWALCLVRLLLGSSFIAHGLQKVFDLFGGQGISAFAGFVASMGLPLWLGQVAAWFELIGGVLVFLGIAAELGALMIFPVMVVAIGLVHNAAYFLQQNGCEYALNLAVLSLVVIIGGPGKCALWDAFKSWRT